MSHTNVLGEVLPAEVKVVLTGDQDDLWKVLEETDTLIRTSQSLKMMKIQMMRIKMKDLVLLVLHHLPIGGLLGQQLPSGALHYAPHGAEAWADPRSQVEVLPLDEEVARKKLNA